MSSLLQQISSLTGGRSRKLDLGSAKAAAQHINSAPVQALHQQLTQELEICKAFEVAYAKRINLENSMMGQRQRKQPSAALGRASTGSADSREGWADAARKEGSAQTYIMESAFGNKPAVNPQKIPPIPKASGLLRGTEARVQYREAMLEHAEDVAAHANDVATRSCGYPKDGPGLLKPAATAWENLRIQHDKSLKRKQAGSGSVKRRPASAPRLQSAAAGLPGHGMPQKSVHRHAEARRASVDGTCLPVENEHSSTKASMSCEKPPGMLYSGNTYRQHGLCLHLDVSGDDEGGDSTSEQQTERTESQLHSFRQSQSRTSSVSHSSLLRALYKIDGTG